MRVVFRRVCWRICTRITVWREQPRTREGTDPCPKSENLMLSVAYQKATSHSLRPVTIKQLLSSTQAHGDADWMLGDCEINQVSPNHHYAAAGCDHLLPKKLGYGHRPCFKCTGKPHEYRIRTWRRHGANRSPTLGGFLDGGR